MTQDQESYRRGTNAALAGLFVQLSLTIAMAIVGLSSQSAALYAATWYLLGGLPIWMILVVLFHQHRLERAEALESEHLGQQDAATAALFEERADDLQLARRRLRNLNRWGLGLVSLFVAVYLLVFGPLLLYLNVGALDGEKLRESSFFALALGANVNTMVLMAACLGVALTAFLVARYVAGMTRVSQWQLLRGGASYLMGNALVAALALIGAVCAHLGTTAVMAYLRLIVPALMTLIGVEILVTSLLAAYRPRLPHETPRPAFDSRVLGLLTTPESIAKAVGDTINYQFGFEVSRSWFYRLLGKSITPLVAFGLLTLVAASSVIRVGPYEQAIVTTFGSAGDPPRIMGPGLHLKWPWPVSSAHEFDVQRVHRLSIGSLEAAMPDDVAILWTNQHAGEEHYLIAAPTVEDVPPAAEREAAGDRQPPPSMSLVGAEVVVQYQIGDLFQYANAAVEPRELLEVIAERVVCAYFAAHDIETLLMRGRPGRAGEPAFVPIGDDLRDRITAETDAAKLGVRVLLVSLASVHPPQRDEVAAAFHTLISAEQDKQSAIEKARREAIRTLSNVAGSEEDARRIHDAIVLRDTLKKELRDAEAGGEGPDGDAYRDAEAKLARHDKKIELLLAAARGEAAAKIYEARAYRWEKALGARSRAERFPAELAAYRNAPRYFRVKRMLKALSEGMVNARKILVATDTGSPPVFRLDLHENRSGVDGLTDPNR